jgi:hypothetical protein
LRQFKYPATWRAGKVLGNKHLYDLEVKPADKGAGESIKVTVHKIVFFFLLEILIRVTVHKIGANYYYYYYYYETINNNLDEGHAGQPS